MKEIDWIPIEKILTSNCETKCKNYEISVDFSYKFK